MYALILSCATSFIILWSCNFFSLIDVNIVLQFYHSAYFLRFLHSKHPFCGTVIRTIYNIPTEVVSCIYIILAVLLPIPFFMITNIKEFIFPPQIYTGSTFLSNIKPQLSPSSSPSDSHQFTETDHQWKSEFFTFYFFTLNNFFYLCSQFPSLERDFWCSLTISFCFKLSKWFGIISKLDNFTAHF